MKLRRLVVYIFGFALLSSGCASLRPPGDDRAAWLGQQEEVTREAEKKLGADAWKFIYEVGSCLGGLVNNR